MPRSARRALPPHTRLLTRLAVGHCSKVQDVERFDLVGGRIQLGVVGDLLVTPCAWRRSAAGEAASHCACSSRQCAAPQVPAGLPVLPSTVQCTPCPTCVARIAPVRQLARGVPPLAAGAPQRRVASNGGGLGGGRGSRGGGRGRGGKGVDCDRRRAAALKGAGQMRAHRTQPLAGSSRGVQQCAAGAFAGPPRRRAFPLRRAARLFSS